MPLSFVAPLIELAMDFVPKPHRREVFGDERARPPTALTWFREAVPIPICADEFWRRVWERVAREQAENSLFTFQQSFDKREEPRV